MPFYRTMATEHSKYVAVVEEGKNTDEKWSNKIK